MKTLRTTFPYGMNERTWNNNKGNDIPVGKSFPPILRSIERSNRSQRNKGNVPKTLFFYFLSVKKKEV